MDESITFFFFNDTATTEIYTLSLHDALPISLLSLQLNLYEVTLTRLEQLLWLLQGSAVRAAGISATLVRMACVDRKSTRLNSSHANISYAVFCLKKKKICIVLLPHVLIHYT